MLQEEIRLRLSRRKTGNVKLLARRTAGLRALGIGHSDASGSPRIREQANCPSYLRSKSQCGVGRRLVDTELGGRRFFLTCRSIPKDVDKLFVEWRGKRGCCAESADHRQEILWTDCAKQTNV